MITNNVAGLAGGGISVVDSLRAVIRNNQIANNDSTATTALAFDPTLNQNGNNLTTPQPAGVVSRLHSPDMALLMTDVIADIPTDWLSFSRPVLRDNIVYENRSFFWLNFDDGDPTNGIDTGLFPANCFPNQCVSDDQLVVDYTDDFGVLEGIVDTGDLHVPRYSLLTDTADNAVYLANATNTTGDPAFVNPYFNGPRGGVNIPEFKTLQTAIAADEGGNFIQVTFSPLTLIETDGDPTTNETTLYDYHITGTSAALDGGGNVAGLLLEDFDNDARAATGNDIGADELAP
jgi:hypothetical protein